VDAAYKLPATIAFSVRVEKDKFVAVRLEVVRVEQNRVVPVSVEKISLVTMREEVIT
jgi:hypothetical protein